jgi:hypothetical protein
MRALFVLFLTATLAQGARSQDLSPCPGWNPPDAKDRRYELFFSPYTRHWTPSDEHKPVYALGFTQRLPNDRSCGFSLFRNSFGQPSGYAYLGKTWNGLLPGIPRLYGSVTAGVLFGYVDRYEGKVPANNHGFSPGLIPALGYRITPAWSVELQLLGSAGLMFGTALRF